MGTFENAVENEKRKEDLGVTQLAERGLEIISSIFKKIFDLRKKKVFCSKHVLKNSKKKLIFQVKKIIFVVENFFYIKNMFLAVSNRFQKI